MRFASNASTAFRRRRRSPAPGLALLLLAALASGCGRSGPEEAAAAEPAPGGEGGGAVEERSSLFVASEADPSLVEFETNDEAYIAERGYTLWALKAAPQSPFSSRAVVLDKTGGCDEAGYGIVFCHGADEERMLVAMINVRQEYIVGEATGSSFAAILPWKVSPLLKRGYNQDNEIGLRLDPAARRFTLAINGVDVDSFAAVEPDYALGGGNGYLVVVSPRDRFPDAPLRVSFREE